MPENSYKWRSFPFPAYVYSDPRWNFKYLKSLIEMYSSPGPLLAHNKLIETYQRHFRNDVFDRGNVSRSLYRISTWYA